MMLHCGRATCVTGARSASCEVVHQRCRLEAPLFHERGIQTVRLRSYSVTGKALLMVLVLAAVIVGRLSSDVLAYTSSRSTDGAVTTWSCSGGACAPFTFYFRWDADVDYDAYFGYVFPYKQTTGGLVNQANNPICPPEPVLGITRYHDSDGYQMIYGWYRIATICQQGQSCPAWSSDEDHTLKASSVWGEFSGWVHWNGGCTPANSPSLTVKITF